jgi:hypothetical protein
MIDAALPALDRDLVDAVRATGCAVVAVDDGHARHDWRQLGVDAVLAEPAERAGVLTVLREHARPLSSFTDDVALVERHEDPASWRGRLIAVLGGGGTGTSTLAMAIAQGLAADAHHAGLVALADLNRRADLALLHDVGDVVPGVQELVDAHRTRTLSSEDVRGLTYFCDDRGYHLLLGLRRSRDWSVLRPRALEVALDGLLRSFRVTVADVDADLEGENEVGSVDVEERHLLTRATLTRADVVVVVASPGLAGVHRGARLIDEVVRFGVDAQRILPVLNRASRAGRVRSDIAQALAASAEALHGGELALASPVFVPERRRLDDAHHDAVPLPRALVETVTNATSAMLERCPPPGRVEPEPIAPGSLGSWRRA